MFRNVIKAGSFRIVCFVVDLSSAINFSELVCSFLHKGISAENGTQGLFTSLLTPWVTCGSISIKFQLTTSPNFSAISWTDRGLKEQHKNCWNKARSKNKQLIFSSGKVFRAIFINESLSVLSWNFSDIIYGCGSFFVVFILRSSEVLSTPMWR